MGVTISAAQAMLNFEFPTSGNTQYIGYSVNGSSEWANLARTAIGATTWATATSADPSVKATNAVLTSGTVTSAGATVTHFAVWSAGPTGGTQLTDWQALDTPRALAVGDSLQWGSAALQITLT